MASMFEGAQMKTPWWVWIPVIGFIGAGIQHTRACVKHKQACKDWMAGKPSDTWAVYELTSIWFGNVTKAGIVTVATLLVLKAFLR